MKELSRSRLSILLKDILQWFKQQSTDIFENIAHDDSILNLHAHIQFF